MGDYARRWGILFEANTSMLTNSERFAADLQCGYVEEAWKQIPITSSNR